NARVPVVAEVDLLVPPGVIHHHVERHALVHEIRRDRAKPSRIDRSDIHSVEPRRMTARGRVPAREWETPDRIDGIALHDARITDVEGRNAAHVQDLVRVRRVVERAVPLEVTSLEDASM